MCEIITAKQMKLHFFKTQLTKKQLTLKTIILDFKHVLVNIKIFD